MFRPTVNHEISRTQPLQHWSATFVPASSSSPLADVPLLRTAFIQAISKLVVRADEGGISHRLVAWIALLVEFTTHMACYRAP